MFWAHRLGCKALIDVLVKRQAVRAMEQADSHTRGILCGTESPCPADGAAADTDCQAPVAASPPRHQRTRSEPSRLAAFASLLGVGVTTAPPPAPPAAALKAVSCKLELHDPASSSVRLQGLPLTLVGGPGGSAALEALRPAAGPEMERLDVEQQQTDPGFELVLLHGQQRSSLVEAVCSCIGLLDGSLTEVQLSGLGIMDSGASVIAGCITRGLTSTLTSLDVSANRLTDAGIVAIVAAVTATPPPMLQLLDLSLNQACDEGAAAITGLVCVRGKTSPTAEAVTNPSPTAADTAAPDTMASMDSSTVIVPSRPEQAVPARAASGRLSLFGLFNIPSIWNSAANPVAAVPALPALHIRLCDNHYPFSPEALMELQTALHQSNRGLAQGAAAAVRLEMVHSSVATIIVCTTQAGLFEPSLQPRQRRSFPGSAGFAPATTAPSFIRGMPSTLPAGLSSFALPPRVPTAAAAASSGIPLPAHRRNVSHVTDSSDPDCGCGVCFAAPNNLTVRGCGHKLCVQCYRQLVNPDSSKKGATCPFCRAPIIGFEYRGWPSQLS